MLTSLFISLISTLLIELPILFMLGVRSRRDILVAVYANVLTNPVVVFLANLLFVFYPSYAWGGISLLEMSAFLTEGFVFKSCFSQKNLNPWVLSFLANLISFETGIVISYFSL